MIVYIQKRYHILFTMLLIFWFGGITITPLLAQSENIYFNLLAKFLYFFYQPVCHQIHERSFNINQYVFTVCIRCFSVYLSGLFLSFYYLYKMRIRLWDISVYGTFFAVAVLDFFLEVIGLYQDLKLIRFITGGILGVAIFHLIIVSMNTRHQTEKGNTIAHR